jgi:hypothetical protein
LGRPFFVPNATEDNEGNEDKLHFVLFVAFCSKEKRTSATAPGWSHHPSLHRSARASPPRVNRRLPQRHGNDAVQQEETEATKTAERDEIGTKEEHETRIPRIWMI